MELTEKKTEEIFENTECSAVLVIKLNISSSLELNRDVHRARNTINTMRLSIRGRIETESGSLENFALSTLLAYGLG